jgi:hypothetical protein
MKTTIHALLAATMLMTLAAPTYAEAIKDGFNIDAGSVTVDKRRKKRIPGGSGCDDARDIIEHPECRI